MPQMFTDVQTGDARDYVVKELIKKGILDKAAQDTEITNIIGAIPPSTAIGYGTDPIVKAANFLSTYYAMNTKEESGKNITTTQAGNITAAGGKRGEFVAPVLPDAQQNKAREILLNKQAERIQNTAMTTVVNFIVRNPKASEMYKGLTVIPTVTPEKLKEYEDNLVDELKNKEAFTRVKEAANKKHMPVHINDLNRKMLGMSVETPKMVEGKTNLTTEQLSNEAIPGFLSIRVIGRIPSEKNGIGCAVTSISSVGKPGKKADVTATLGRPRVKFVGKTAAMADPTEKFILIANEYSMVGTKKEVKKGRLRIAESFKVYSGTETDSKGNRKTKTIRLSGECTSIPVMKRKTEFIAKFGDETDAKVISAHLSDADKAKALELTLDLAAAAVGGKIAGGVGGLGTEFNELIAQIKQADNAAGTKAVANFE